MHPLSLLFFFFFNDTATTEIYTLSLHDALPISAQQFIPNVGRIRARLHPDAFLNPRISARKRPDRGGAFEAKPFNLAVALGSDPAAVPAVGRQRIGLAFVMGGFVEFGDEQCAPQGRFERGHEKAVIAASGVARDGAGGKTANSVGDQPFALFIRFERAANLPAEIDGQRDACGGPLYGGRSGEHTSEL